jgi:gamma-carbonic anhydrase
MDTSKVRRQLTKDALYPYKKLTPQVHESVFIAPGAKIIGDVKIAEYSTVWYNTVIRGDVHYINIGRFTNIQDCSMLHVTNGVYPLNIGDYVTVGHSVKLHGCTIKNLCLLGIGSIVLDGAIVEEKSIVAAGAVVVPNFVVPSGKMIAGVPAKVIRDLNDKELNEFEKMAIRYKNYGEESLNSLSELIR